MNSFYFFIIQYSTILISIYYLKPGFAQNIFTDQNFIFSALPTQIIDQDGDLKGPLIMLKVESKQLILFSFGESGIGLYNEKSYKLDRLDFEEQVEQIILLDESEYVLVGFSKFVIIHQIIERNQDNYQIISQQKIDLYDVTIIKLIHLSKMNKVFIIGLIGEIISFNYLGQGRLQYDTKYFFQNDYILTGQVNNNEQFLFLCGESQSIRIYEIIKEETQDGKINIIDFVYIIGLNSDYQVKQIVLLELNTFFVYYIDSWTGLYYADLTPLNSSSLTERQKIKGYHFGLGTANISPTTVNLLLNKMQNYLFVGVRSQGVLIYDISTKTNPLLYYQLFMDAQSYSLLLSDDEQTLYFSNSNGLFKYKKNLLQLGTDIPNLFNYHKSKSLFDGGSLYKWRCQIEKKKKILYGAFDIDNVQRFYIEENDFMEGSIRLQHIDEIPYENDLEVSNISYIDSILFDQDENHLFIPIVTPQYAAIKYAIPQDQDLFSPLVAKQFLKHDYPQYSETMRLSSDNKFIVMSYVVGILLVDNDKFEVIKHFVIPEIKQSCYGVDFTRDSKYVFATARNIGIWIIDIQDMQQPVIKQVQRTRGGESVRASHLFDIMYVMDGINGLLIYDTTSLPNINILGSIKLQGWVNDITLLNNENYGIVSTMDRGMIWLINLIDKSTPLLISSYQIDQQNAQSTCIDPNMKYLIILNSQSVRYFPLVSSVLIHYECSLKQTIIQSVYNRQILGQSDFLEVGQTYELRLIPLYRKKNQLICNVYLYQNQKKLDLPSWIDHIAEQYLELTIPKEVLNNSSNNSNNVFIQSKYDGNSTSSNNSWITLLVKSCFSIKENSFMFQTSTFSVSKELSKKIYLFLKTNSFIDSQSLLTDLYNPEISLEFNDFGNEVTDENVKNDIILSIRDLLQNSIDYNPISFKVKSSLYYIFDKRLNIFQVQSISNRVSIQFSFNLNQSLIFVQKNYPNVITFRNEQDTTLSFDSSIDIINNILKQNIIFHKINVTNNESTVFLDESMNQISVVISDGINGDLSLKFSIHDLTFLKLKSPIIQQNSLQPQVEKISSDSDFAIESSLSIQFDDKSFIDPDNIPIKYELLMYQDGNYRQIPPQYFLKFDSENIRISGTPTTDVLFEVIHLRLTASNGYTQTFDDFYISVYKVSLMYVLNQTVRILGPIAFILGIYKQRSYFINAIWKKRTFYTNEFAQVSQSYRKKITLLGNELIIAQLFFNKFCSKNQNKTQIITQNNFSQNNLDSFNQSEKEDHSEIRRNNILTTQPQQINQPSINYKNTSLEVIDQVTQQNEKDTKWKRYSYLNNSMKKGPTLAAKRHKSTPTIDIKPVLAQYKKQQKQQLAFPGIPLQQKNQSNVINTSMNEIKRNTTHFPLYKKVTYKLTEQEEARVQATRKSIHDARKKKIPFNDIIFNLCYSNPLTVQNMNYNKQIVPLDSDDNTFFENRISTDQLFNKMLLDDLDITFKNKKLKICSYIKEYQNKYSRFHQCLHACVVNYLLRLDTRTYIVYKYLKDYAKLSLNFTKKDWYKAYVTVEPTNEFDCYGLPIPFSKIHINEQSFIPCFSHLQIYGGKQSFFNDIYDHGINPVLLKEALIYASLGLLTNNTNRGFMNKSKGESIHLQQHEILSVEAFKLKEHSRMKCIRKVFNLEYQRMPISKYLSLPSWIQFDCKNGVIMLEGIPTHSDIEEVLIRVYNTQYCIVMQYFLKISDESNPDNTNLDNNQSYKLNQSGENVSESISKLNNFNNSSNNVNNQTDMNMLSKRQKRSVFCLSPQKVPQQTLPSLSQKSLNFDYVMQQLDSLPPQQLDHLPPSFLEQSMKRSQNLSNTSNLNNNSNNKKHRSKKNKFSLFLYSFNRQNSKQESQYSEEIDQSGIINQNNNTFITKKFSKSLTDVSSQQSQNINNKLSSSSSQSESLDQTSSFTGENHNLPKQTNLNSNPNPFIDRQDTV